MNSNYMYPLSVNNGQDYDQGITQRDALAFDIYARAVTNAATLANSSCDPSKLTYGGMIVLAEASLLAADAFIKQREAHDKPGE